MGDVRDACRCGAGELHHDVLVVFREADQCRLDSIRPELALGLPATSSAPGSPRGPCVSARALASAASSSGSESASTTCSVLARVCQAMLAERAKPSSGGAPRSSTTVRRPGWRPTARRLARTSRRQNPKHVALEPGKALCELGQLRLGQHQHLEVLGDAHRAHAGCLVRSDISRSSRRGRRGSPSASRPYDPRQGPQPTGFEHVHLPRDVPLGHEHGSGPKLRPSRLSTCARDLAPSSQ